MAYTTCTFWIKFFVYIILIGTVGSLIIQLYPSTLINFLTGYLIVGIIFSPILFVNQISKLITKEKTLSNFYFQKLNKEWLKENIDSIRNEYVNKFIALSNNQIIATDSNLNILKEKLKNQSLDPKNIYIQFINDKKKSQILKKLG